MRTPTSGWRTAKAKRGSPSGATPGTRRCAMRWPQRGSCRPSCRGESGANYGFNGQQVVPGMVDLWCTGARRRHDGGPRRHGTQGRHLQWQLDRLSPRCHDRRVGRANAAALVRRHARPQHGRDWRDRQHEERWLHHAAVRPWPGRLPPGLGSHPQRPAAQAGRHRCRSVA